jgi:GNAT superfamily N-acetyltransferase
MTQPNPAQNWTLDNSLHPGDVEQIVKMHGTLYAREYAFDSTFEDYVARPLNQFVRSRGPRDQIWLARRTEQIVGCVAIVEASAGEAQLRWFLVDPSARGSGLGTRLLREAVEFARTSGYSSIFLWTVSALEDAARLYQRAGFAKVEAKPGRHWGVEVVEERYVLAL